MLSNTKVSVLDSTLFTPPQCMLVDHFSMRCLHLQHDYLHPSRLKPALGRLLLKAYKICFEALPMLLYTMAIGLASSLLACWPSEQKGTDGRNLTNSWLAGRRHVELRRIPPLPV